MYIYLYEISYSSMIVGVCPNGPQVSIKGLPSHALSRRARGGRKRGRDGTGDGGRGGRGGRGLMPPAAWRRHVLSFYIEQDGRL